jgi:ATP-dependent DNA ligase
VPADRIRSLQERWVHAIKHDGYRLIARRDGDRVRLYTRRGYVWTDRYPRIVDALCSLRVRSITIDGEAVWCRKDGRADFDRLHSRAHDEDVFLYAFDLIGLDGEDLRPAPSEQRKGKLEKLLARGAGIRFSEHLDGDGATIFEHACKLGLEGIVSKRRDLPLPFRPMQGMGEGEKSAEPGRPTDRGWDVVKGMSAFGSGSRRDSACF